jgi:predicted Fe-Mo cluster-binding NifX family protein
VHSSNRTHRTCCYAESAPDETCPSEDPGKYPSDMIVCVPVTSDGQVDHRWGRAEWIAVANIVNGEVESWQEIEVSWDRLHDEGTSAQHHARVARFLRQNHVEGVVAHHVGDGMVRMLDTMKLPLFLEATGDARIAVLATTS